MNEEDQELPATEENDIDLPAKPPISDPMPSDDELEGEEEPGDEDVGDHEFMGPESATQDDTVDNEERDEGEGTRFQRPDDL